MKFISEPGLDKRKHAEEILGGTPSMEDIVQKVAELEYLEEVEVYKAQRAAKYPDFGSQLDHIYHNGIDDWKTNIVNPVKAQYPKVAIDASVLAARKATALADYQAKEYIKATARLAQYQLSAGDAESTKTIVTGKDSLLEDITETITIPAIPALDATIEVITHEIDKDPVTGTVANPLIVKDNEERTAAQLVIDNTPQPVKDEVDGV